MKCEKLKCNTIKNYNDSVTTGGIHLKSHNFVTDKCVVMADRLPNAVISA